VLSTSPTKILAKTHARILETDQMLDFARALVMAPAWEFPATDQN